MEMNNIKLLTAGFIVFSMASGAHALSEVEPNDSLSSAQTLSGASSHSITGMMGSAGDTSHGDLDFFTFQAQAGDVLDIDIDNGIGGNGDINSIVAIYDDATTLLRMNAYSNGIDPGSTSTLDARIDKFVAPKSGTYTVAVSTVPRYFVNGGGIMSFFGTTTTQVGDYTLTISGITAVNKTRQINIEVKPGIKDLAPLNPRSMGKVPVAIMGSADFDVSAIKQDTLSFGSSGNEKSLSKCQPQTRDINRDGYPDQLCHFENNVAGFKSGDIEGILKGSIDGNVQFEGRALIKVVPTQKK